MESAVIYFGNSLPKETYRNDALRNATLSNGRKLLLECPGVEIVSELPAMCALVVRASEDGLNHVRDLLHASQLGKLSVSDPRKPMFRAAT